MIDRVIPHRWSLPDIVATAVSVIVLSVAGYLWWSDNSPILIEHRAPSVAEARLVPGGYLRLTYDVEKVRDLEGTMLRTITGRDCSDIQVSWTLPTAATSFRAGQRYQGDIFVTLPDSMTGGDWRYSTTILYQGFFEDYRHPFTDVRFQLPCTP